MQHGSLDRDWPVRQTPASGFGSKNSHGNEFITEKKLFVVAKCIVNKIIKSSEVFVHHLLKIIVHIFLGLNLNENY